MSRWSGTVLSPAENPITVVEYSNSLGHRGLTFWFNRKRLDGWEQDRSLHLNDADTRALVRWLDARGFLNPRRWWQFWRAA